MNSLTSEFAHNGEAEWIDRLVEAGLSWTEQAESVFVVAAYPDFYTRFGFVPAIADSIIHGFNGMPQDLLAIWWLKKE